MDKINRPQLWFWFSLALVLVTGFAGNMMASSMFLCTAYIIDTINQKADK